MSTRRGRGCDGGIPYVLFLFSLFDARFAALRSACPSYAPTLYIVLMYTGLALAFGSCDDVRGAFGDVGLLSKASSYAPDSRWAYTVYKLCWAAATFTLFGVAAYPPI